jgi:hypothetical protein
VILTSGFNLDSGVYLTHIRQKHLRNAWSKDIQAEAFSVSHKLPVFDAPIAFRYYHPQCRYFYTTPWLSRSLPTIALLPNITSPSHSRCTTDSLLRPTHHTFSYKSRAVWGNLILTSLNTPSGAEDGFVVSTSSSLTSRYYRREGHELKILYCELAKLIMRGRRNWDMLLSSHPLGHESIRCHTTLPSYPPPIERRENNFGK